MGKIYDIFIDNKLFLSITIILLVMSYIFNQYFHYTIPEVIFTNLGTIILLYGIYNYIFRCDTK